MTISDFFRIAAKLKKVQRQGWVDKLSVDVPESVADHTYVMAIMGMVISDLENYNSEKILKMILLHDLAESLVGDYTPEQITAEKKRELENSAFEDILQNLPQRIQAAYLKLWQEYQENSSFESQLVHQVDKLEMALQAKLYEREGYSKEKTNLFSKSAESSITNTKLKELFGQIMDK